MLSALEKQIADLAARDLRDYEIARTLEISEDVVVHNLLHIFRELKVRSRNELSFRLRPQAQGQAFGDD